MHKRKKYTLVDAILTAGMLLIIAATLYPFIYVISMSLSSPEFVLSKEVYFLPKGFSIGSYKIILAEPDVILAFKNSIWYTAVGTFVSITLTCTAAYVLSRSQFFLRRQLMFLMVLTMFISGGLIPLYVVVSELGLYNTRWAIILPYAVSTFNLIVARTYFEGIPDSLPESAKIDGANDWTILFRIIMPLSKPIIAVLVLFYGVGYWNSYFAPLIYLADKDLQPIQLYLRSILITNTMSSASQSANVGIERALMNEQLKYSTIVISVFPITILYPFVQKYFNQGVMVGAVKG
jgi:putative aldouronate transport system permease protein